MWLVTPVFGRVHILAPLPGKILTLILPLNVEIPRTYHVRIRAGYRIPDSGSYFCLLLHGVYDLGELTDFSCLDGSYRGAVEAIDTAGGLRGLDG